MAQVPTSPRQFTGWHMLGVMGAFFGVVIGVNVTLAVLANRTWSGLIVNNGYVASQQFNREEQRLREQALLGWTANIAAKSDAITITMTDAAGKPLTGLQVSAVLKRAVTELQDKPLAFSEAGPGLYRVATAVAPGKWNIEMAARDFQGHDFQQTYHFMVEPAAQ
jgi:nitrogen fixation protein FixH